MVVVRNGWGVLVLAIAIAGCQGSAVEGPAGPTRPVPFPGDPDACGGPVSVGVAPLRRVTNSQYVNAVRDLLAPLDLSAVTSEGMVPESSLGGFRSNASIPISDLEFRSYSDLAGVAATAVAADVETVTGCRGADRVEQESCVRSWLPDFVLRAYRRPAPAGEVDRLVQLYALVRDEEPFAGSVSAVVEAVLQSPHFLYRVELHEGATPGEVVALDGYQVAARLAFFLWDTIPDQQLLDAAESGALLTADGVNGHARRMLTAPEGQRAIESFHLQWLGVDHVESAEKSDEVFPGFTPELASLMRDETAHFVDEVVRRGDGRFETLLLGGFSYLRGDLYDHYGLGAGPDEWTRVDLDPDLRPGLITHASFLASHAHPDQTSPVHRGKVIREAFFCESLPSPPDDVDDTPPETDPNATTRERFAVHTESPRCAGCHQAMDPIGFALEGYDGVGRVRTLEAGRPVDTSGMLYGTDVEGEIDGARQLSERIYASTLARQCMVRSWYRFAVDRMETEQDVCSLLGVFNAFESSELNVRELIYAIARSDAFRQTRVPEVAP